MSYRSNSIRNIRTIKAQRGEALRIDLGEDFSGTLTAWMKRSPNDAEYRSFEVQDGRYLYLSESKASDYYTEGVVSSAVEGKWYFDVEQDNGVDDKSTIYRGTILFQNDVTNSNGTEYPPDLDGRYRTVSIVLSDPLTESVDGLVETQNEANEQFASAIKLLQGEEKEAAYNFDDTISGAPNQGDITFDANEFALVGSMQMHKLDKDGLNNSYFIAALQEGDFLTLTDVNSTNAVVFEVISEAVLSGDTYTIGVNEDSSVGTIFANGAAIGVDGLITSEGGGLITEDIESIGVGTVGGIDEGEIITEGTPLTGFVKRLIQKVIPPTYTPPTASLSISPSGNQEIGATLDFTLTPSFNQNDGGAVNQVVFRRNGSIIQTQLDLTPFVDTNRVVQAGSNPYSVEISYDDGPIKDDNFGNPYPIGQILAGTAIGNNSINGAYRNWYGTYGLTPPATGAGIRTLDFTYSNSFILNTGDTSLNQVVAVPSTKSLSSVIDLDALNANITSSYVLSGTITSVPDGGGNLVSYNVYILTLAVAYSENHRHDVTIS